MAELYLLGFSEYTTVVAVGVLWRVFLPETLLSVVYKLITPTDSGCGPEWITHILLVEFVSQKIHVSYR